MFELYLHYYPHKASPSDIILLDTETQQHYAWLEIFDFSFHNGWNKIKKISLKGYIKAGPLSFLILTGKDYYSNLPKGKDNEKGKQP